MAQARKARAVGFNHVAIEVGDIDEALAFYGRLFEFKLRGRSEDSWFTRRWCGGYRAVHLGVRAPNVRGVR